MLVFFMMAMMKMSFADAPIITDFNPKSAPAGTVVTITGFNFLNPAVFEVLFGNVSAVSGSINIIDDNTIEATISSSGSTGDVDVINNDGIGTMAGFKFQAAPACNLSGPLAPCLSAGDILVVAEILNSTANPNLVFTLTTNTNPPSTITEGIHQYYPDSDYMEVPIVIHPGSGGQITLSLVITTTDTDADGGITSCSKSITFNNVGAVLYMQTPIPCFGGTATLRAGGSSNLTGPTYTYSLHPGGTVIGPTTNNTVYFSGVTPNTYTVTVVDNTGCSAISESRIVTQPTEVIASDAHTNVTCFGSNNGTVTLSFSGGTPPYKVEWNGVGGFVAQVTDVVYNNLAPGTYTWKVRDKNNCEKTGSEIV